MEGTVLFWKSRRGRLKETDGEREGRGWADRLQLRIRAHFGEELQVNVAKQLVEAARGAHALHWIEQRHLLVILHFDSICAGNHASRDARDPREVLAALLVQLVAASEILDGIARDQVVADLHAVFPERNLYDVLAKFCLGGCRLVQEHLMLVGFLFWTGAVVEDFMNGHILDNDLVLERSAANVGGELDELVNGLVVVHVGYVESDLVARVVHVQMEYVERLHCLVRLVGLRPDLDGAVRDEALHFLLGQVVELHLQAKVYIRDPLNDARLLAHLDIVVVEIYALRPHFERAALAVLHEVADEEPPLLRFVDLGTEPRQVALLLADDFVLVDELHQVDFDLSAGDLLDFAADALQ